MGLFENIRNQCKIAHKIERLISIATEESNNVLAEALFLIYPLFGEVDLTLYNHVKKILLASTVLNEDILDAIRAELGSLNDYECVNGIVVYEKEKMSRLRPGVIKLGVVPLFTDMDRDIVLAVEYYSKIGGIKLSKLENVFKVLTLVVRNIYLSGLGQEALRMDGSTMLPNREALIERLEKSMAAGVKRCSLGLITLSNASFLNEKQGILETDRILRAIGTELGKMMPGCVYRVGGTKFGVVISGDVFYAMPVLEGLVDRVLSLNKNIVTANVLCPLAENVYQTLFICESHLKHCEWDVVTVVTGAVQAEYETEYKNVRDTYFFDVGREEPDEKDIQMCEINKQYENKTIDDNEFILNDMSEFERWHVNE